MGTSAGVIHSLRLKLATGSLRPFELARGSFNLSNRNSGGNTYLWQDETWTMAEAAHAEAVPRSEGGLFGDGRSPLWGLPISVRDCFDLAGAPTSCGVRFYRDLHGAAAQDSWLVEQLRAAGAVITGKTHLHPLAYGITGENPEFGDCVQPNDPGALTGGSSSGAAASVLEGSAVAAIGTDTGGSIRVPAALCGLAGFRASLGRGNWRGAAHLAPSFDTFGWLFRDLEDAPILASLFSPDGPVSTCKFSRFAVIDESFLHDCEPEIVAGLQNTVAELKALGLSRSTFDPAWWADSFGIYAPIQAWEAAQTHAGHFDRFEPSIRERLEWGSRITEPEMASLHVSHAAFLGRMNELFATHQLLLLPAAPVARLAAGADHRLTRVSLLRYTTPFSLAGVPVVTLPCAAGGMQLAAAHNCDESLVQLAAALGAGKKSSSTI
jgi:aspartyl-tRNA(Asn)/glutamyl-tRNA(Gln) amidotransferase subunit A